MSLRLAQSGRSLFLAEFLAAFALSVRYMFKPKATLNYPNEKSPLSLGWLVLTAGVLVSTGWVPR